MDYPLSNATRAHAVCASQSTSEPSLLAPSFRSAFKERWQRDQSAQRPPTYSCDSRDRSSRCISWQRDRCWGDVSCRRAANTNLIEPGSISLLPSERQTGRAGNVGCDEFTRYGTTRLLACMNGCSATVCRTLRRPQSGHSSRSWSWSRPQSWQMK